MSEPTLTIELTAQEARALARMAGMWTAALVRDTDRQPSALACAQMKLETALMTEGAEVR